MKRIPDNAVSVRELTDRLVRAWCLAYSWVLEYCRLEGCVVELCDRLRSAMELFMSGSDDYVLGFVPCQIIDGDERVGAVYLSSGNGGSPYLLVASYTILSDIVYAGFTLLHEIAHHIGFGDEDLADFISLLVVDENVRRSLLEFLEKPPRVVEQAIDKAIYDGNTCSIRDLERLLSSRGLVRVYKFNCDSATGS